MRWSLTCTPSTKLWSFAFDRWEWSSSLNLGLFTTSLSRARVGRTSVNGETGLASAPSCELGHVLGKVLLRVLFWRQAHCRRVRIFLRRVDVKHAFRQVLGDPAGAPAVRYVFGGHAVVHLCLKFGRLNSPGFWVVIASAREHMLTSTLRFNVQLCPGRDSRCRGCSTFPGAGVPVVQLLPRDCRPVPGSESNTAGARFSCGTTFTTAFSSRCRGGRTAAATSAPCSRLRRIIYAN